MQKEGQIIASPTLLQRFIRQTLFIAATILRRMVDGEVNILKCHRIISQIILVGDSDHRHFHSTGNLRILQEGVGRRLH